MDPIEKWLTKHAIYDPEQIRPAPVRDIFKKYAISTLSNHGMLSYVYKFNDYPWVVKEGKWNVDLHVLGDLKFTVPMQVGEKVLRDRILPRHSEISRQYGLYLKLIKYLGFFSTTNYSHPDLPSIRLQQLLLRDHLSSYITDLHHVFKIKYRDALEEILTSDLKYKNFLPKEFTVVGESWHPDNGGRETYFIFQEYVAGSSLHDTPWKSIETSDSQRRELILLLFLLLLFYKREKLVVDTRPRSPAAQIHEWVMKTDNIFVSDSGFTLVDTRWCWQAEEDLFRRGLLVPEFTVWRLHWWLNHLLHLESNRNQPKFVANISSKMNLKEFGKRWLKKGLDKSNIKLKILSR